VRELQCAGLAAPLTAEGSVAPCWNPPDAGGTDLFAYEVESDQPPAIPEGTRGNIYNPFKNKSLT